MTPIMSKAERASWSVSGRKLPTRRIRRGTPSSNDGDGSVMSVGSAPATVDFREGSML